VIFEQIELKDEIPYKASRDLIYVINIKEKKHCLVFRSSLTARRIQRQKYEAHGLYEFRTIGSLLRTVYELNYQKLTIFYAGPKDKFPHLVQNLYIKMDQRMRRRKNKAR